MHSLKVFEFDVEIDAADISNELVDRVFDAGCDDAILCKTDRVVYLSFERKDKTRDLAVRNAIRALDEAGIPVVSTGHPLAAN